MEDDSTFPTTTFESVEFSGCGAIKPNFRGELKFEVDNAPQALLDLQSLHAAKGKLVFISDQAQIPKGAEAGTWATSRLPEDEEGLVYQEHCIGAPCGFFAAHTSGEFEGKYVCEQGADVSAFMEVVYGETYCPLYPAPAPGDETVDAGGETEEAIAETEEPEPVADPKPEPLAAVSVVVAIYPGFEDPVVTKIGAKTRYGELVADYLAAQGISDGPMGDYQVRGEDDGLVRKQRSIIGGLDYGKRLIVELTAEAAIARGDASAKVGAA